MRSLDSPNEFAHACLRINRGEARLELHLTLGDLERVLDTMRKRTYVTTEIEAPD